MGMMNSSRTMNHGPIIWGTQGVTDRYFVSSYWTFCPVIWLFGDVELWDFCWICLRKVVVFVCWDCNSSVAERCPVKTSCQTQGNYRIYLLNCAKKVDKKSDFMWIFTKKCTPNLQYFSKNRQIRHRIWLPKVQFFFKSGQNFGDLAPIPFCSSLIQKG